MMFRLENQDSRLNSQRHGNSVGLEYPFTVAQWKELQRQAMVYKYLAASVPVPPHLLLPIATDSRFSSNCNYSLRFGRDGDPEPGRCKRTDGKKWRCSKEALPDERYCDRHLKKRGHPRSRKLVEQVSCKKACHGQKLENCSSGSAITNSLAPVFLCSNGDEGLLQPKEPRALDWLMIGENRRPEVDPNVYTGYDASKVNHHQHHRFNEYLFSLDSDLVIPRTQKPDTVSRGGFIDAWSDKQSPSAPTLSAIDDEMGRIHMGLGVTSWVGSGSWISSSATPPGGPLAEVLQHRSTSPSSESPSPSSLTVEPEITLQWFTN